MAKKLTTVQTHQEVEPLIGGVIEPISFFTDIDIAPGWDFVDRDAYLRQFWKKFGNDMLQAVLATVVAKVQTQNWELEGPERMAELYHRVLRDDSDFGRGYDYLIARGVADYYTQDNGWFMERQRSGPKDFDGPMLGIAHLDSRRMKSTGNAKFPFTYMDVHGAYHLMHNSQIIRIVDMPSPATELYDPMRGFCALSRTLSTSMILTMLVAMKREKLADLPPSALAIFNNINRKQFEQALRLKGVEEDMAGDVVWRQLLPLFGIDPAHPASVQFVSLREVWEGYSDQTQYDISAYSYAAGFRIDPREFWPVSQGPLGTGKEAEIQHEKAKAKSHGLLFTHIERVLNSNLSLPKQLHFKYALQDIDEEQQRAAIHQLQIGNIKAMQESGAGLTPEEVRFLLTNEYKVLPRTMAKVPAEGEIVDLTSSDVYVDDVERQTKEFGFYFGPDVVLDSTGAKIYLGKDTILARPVPVLYSVKETPELQPGNGSDALVASLDVGSCCESHAFQEFPNIVEGLKEQGVITPEEAYAANMVTPLHTGQFSKAVQQAIKAGKDPVDSAKQELIMLLGSKEFNLGDKETAALTTIRQKIATLPRSQAREVREASDRLMASVDPKRRLQAIRDIPDEIWDRAVRADLLDEQPEEA